MIAAQVILTCVLSNYTIASPEGDERRFEKACAHLDQARVEKFKKRAESLFAQDLKKSKVLKDLRASSDEQGVRKEFDKCLIAIMKMENAKRERQRKEEEAEEFRKMKEALTVQEKEWIQYVGKIRAEEIEKAKERITYLRNYKRTPLPPGARFPRGFSGGVVYEPNPTVEIPRLQKRLDLLEANDPPFVPTIKSTELEIGVIGQLPSVQVYRIINESEVVVEFFSREYVRLGLAGVPTQKLVDGKKFKPEGVFKITRTKEMSGILYLADPFPVDPAKLAKFMP